MPATNSSSEPTADAKNQTSQNSKTTKMELDRDYTINGVVYSKGTDVEVQSDHKSAIEDMQKANQEHMDWAQVHHGAVPMSADPQAATAQTPTRPLGGDHLRMEEGAANQTVVTDAETVKDPSHDVKAQDNVASAPNQAPKQ